MNRQTLITLLVVAAVAGVGFYLYKQNQRDRITNPPNSGSGDDGNIFDQAGDLWDDLSGIFNR